MSPVPTTSTENATAGDTALRGRNTLLGRLRELMSLALGAWISSSSRGLCVRPQFLATPTTNPRQAFSQASTPRLALFSKPAESQRESNRVTGGRRRVSTLSLFLSRRRRGDISSPR
jgi:hypothetical protein